MDKLQEMIKFEYKPQPLPIQFDNYEELKKQIAETLDVYKAEVVTPETCREAKKTLAYLNKLKDTLKRNRIGIQKVLLSEFTDFEAKSKELEKMVEETHSVISKKVKALSEPEETASHTIQFECTERQFKALMKAFERQEVTVNEVTDDEPETPKAKEPEKAPAEKKEKAANIDKYLKEAKDAVTKAVPEETVNDRHRKLLEKVEKLQKELGISDASIEKTMKVAKSEMTFADLERCHELLKKHAAMIKFRKGA